MLKHTLVLLAVSLIHFTSAQAADGDHCGDPDHGMDTSSLIKPLPVGTNQPDDTTVVSIRDGYGNDRLIRIKGAPGSGKRFFAVESGYYLQCELKKQRTILFRQAKAIADKSPETGSKEFEQAVALKMRIDKLDREINDGALIKESIRQYGDVMSLALAACHKGGKAECSGDEAKQLSGKMAALAAYDQKFAAPGMRDFRALTTANLFDEAAAGKYQGDGDSSARRLKGNIVFERLGFEQVTCSGDKCTVGDALQPPKPAQVEPPKPKDPELNAGETGGKALNPKEIDAQSKRFGGELEALSKCAKAHVRPNKPLSELSDADLDQAFEKDFRASQGELSKGAAAALKEARSRFVAALAEIPGAPATGGQIEKLSAQLEAPSGIDGFNSAFTQLAALVQSTDAKATATSNADFHPGPKNEKPKALIVLSEAKRDIMGIIYRRYPFGALQSAAACRALARQLSGHAKGLHKLTGAAAPSAEHGIRTKSGDCIFGQVDLIKNLDQVISSASDASGASESDPKTIEELKAELAALSPSERAVVYQMIADYGRQNFESGDEAVVSAARAELTDRIRAMIARLK